MGAIDKDDGKLPTKTRGSKADSLITGVTSLFGGFMPSGDNSAPITTFEEEARRDPIGMAELLDKKILNIRSISLGVQNPFREYSPTRIYSSSDNQSFIEILGSTGNEVQISMIRELLKRFEDLMTFAYGSMGPKDPNKGMSVLFTEIVEILDPGNKGAPIDPSLRFLTNRTNMEEAVRYFGFLRTTIRSKQDKEIMPIGPYDEELPAITGAMLEYELNFQKALSHLEARSFMIGEVKPR